MSTSTVTSRPLSIGVDNSNLLATFDFPDDPRVKVKLTTVPSSPIVIVRRPPITLLDLPPGFPKSSLFLLPSEGLKWL